MLAEIPTKLCPTMSPDPLVRSGWARRWWGALSVAVQLAVASTALGCAWPAAPLPGPSDGPALDRVLDLAADAGPSRLPLRPLLGTASRRIGVVVGAR